MLFYTIKQKAASVASYLMLLYTIKLTPFTGRFALTLMQSSFSLSSFKSHKTAKSVWDVVGKNMEVAQRDKALLRRIRDFKFAQRKRKACGEGDQPAIGILGIYESLQGVRRDIEWAEDSAWRRVNNLPYLKWRDFEKSDR